MLQAREKRDQARYKEISNAKGTALHNLKQRETMAKSEDQADNRVSETRTTTSSTGQVFNIVKKVNKPESKQSESQSNSPAYKTYEWVKCFLDDMKKLPKDTLYEEKLTVKINSMLDGWSFRLSPEVFVKSYISAVHQNSQLDQGQRRQSEAQISQIYSSDIKQKPTFSTSPPSHKSSGVGSFYDNASMVGSVIQQQDIIDADDDIAGLSVAGVNQAFKTKFIVLRYHLEKMKDHPLMRIIQVFRELLISFIKQKNTDIKESLGFVESKEDRENLMVSNTEKLFRKVTEDIKSFTIIMHDACVRFYEFDAKQSDGEVIDCLYNLIISLILKTPVYADVHILVQYMHKQKVLKIAKTIEILRKTYNIEERLGISPVKMGRAILRNKYRLAEMEDAEDLMGSTDQRLDADFRNRINTDDQLAREAFQEVAHKIELVRKTSSPILKVIKFARAMEDLMAVDTCAGEVQAADDALPLIFYLIVEMKTKDAKFLGSRFLEEYTYVEEYCYEDQQIMQEFCNYMHLSTALQQLEEGPKACYRSFLAPDDEVFSDDEDQVLPGNTRMSLRASMQMNSRASIRASVAMGRKSMAVERKLSCIPEDAQTFEELFSEANLECIEEQSKDSISSRPSSKSKLMQRLQDQGIFELKPQSSETPGSETQDLNAMQEESMPSQKQVKRQFETPSIVKAKEKTTQEEKKIGQPLPLKDSGESYPEPQDVPPQIGTVVIPNNNMKYSLGGKIQMQSIGGQTSSTLASSQHKSTLASSKLNSTAQGVNLSSVNETTPKPALPANKLGGLMPIEEEEQVLVEEGCDFELDENSKAIQNIRISDKNSGSNKHSSNSPKSDQMIKSSVLKSELFKDLEQQKKE